ncbi:hypothetical protein OS493_022983 [Desmophyllum pertusum]|uniref:CHAT domain-containing protein n=1 Tax=Desmophyllum pertusum TaxID=174260 RepID=A0A9X0CYS3_9CNID|nr:hypothetical protein OS493_022983 [Desmophyllum pertusum]
MDKVDVLEAWNIIQSVATFFMKTNRCHAAIEFYKEMLTLVKIVENVTSSRQDRMNMTIYEHLAEAYFRIGNYNESKANAKLALQINNKIGDKNRKLTSYCKLYEVSFNLGRYDKAIKYLEKALQISRETGDAEKEAEIYCNLGAPHYFLGQLDRAMAYLLKSLKLSKEIGHRTMEARALTVLGSLFLGLGKVSQSVQKLEEALKISEEIGDGCSGVSILSHLGRAYQYLNQYDKSIEYYQASRRVSKEIRNSENEGRACCRLGFCLFLVKKYDEAIRYSEQALEIGKSTGDREIRQQACATLVRIHLVLGQNERATEYKEQAMKSTAEDGDRVVPRSLVLLRLALGYAQGGKMQQACDILSESIRYYESEREPLNNEHKLSLGDMKLSIIAYKYHCHYLITLGKVRDALCTAERGRARVLGELLSKKYAIQETRVGLVNEDNLNSLIRSLKKEQLLVFMAVIDNAILFWVMTNEEELMIRHRKESSESNVHDMLEYILQGNFRSLAHGRDIECKDRSLSAFYDSESTADGKESERKKGKRLVKLNDKDSDEENAINASHQLYNMLISPFADRIEGREVVLVPEGSMFMVPFSALQDAEGKFLSETCRIRIIPSLTTLKLIQDCKADYHSTTGALIVGDPDVSRVPRLGQLPAARQEANEIADLLNVSALLGEQATKEEVLRRITDVCLIHIAAHGDAERGEIFCTPNPSSPQVPRKEDFMLTMEDIAKVGVRAKLVVLSCCHSGRGKILKAEGVVGIARAFIASGARSVLVSLWLLDDKSTKDFMIRFYGHLVRDKLSASEALHRSIKWMRESKMYIVSDWAPFVLIGDDATLDL